MSNSLRSLGAQNYIFGPSGLKMFKLWSHNVHCETDHRAPSLLLLYNLLASVFYLRIMQSFYLKFSVFPPDA